jgi:hypothetical protein
MDVWSLEAVGGPPGPTPSNFKVRRRSGLGRSL